ncbi:MAG: prolyl oligopeptidase family serine peptidase [Deltaproteobacteria bacterium]|nr:prolyl oligopeptidase family serine peptidase [Deltaproteobacteria bacterium]
MGTRTPLPTTRNSRRYGHNRAICSAAAAAVLLAPAFAVADGELAFRPGPDGVLSTWLAAGPFPARGTKTTPASSLGRLGAATPERGAAAQTPDGTRTWIAFGSRGAWTNLKDLPGGGEVAWLSCVLETERPTRGVLSLAVNRGSTVWLGDTILYRRTDGGLIRQDFEYIPFDLPAGRTVLRMRVPRTAPRNWGAFVRLLGADLAPAPEITVRLPGVGLDDSLAAFADVTLRREPTSRGFDLVASASFAGGGPVATGVRLAVEVAGTEADATFDAPGSGRVLLHWDPPRDMVTSARLTLGARSSQLPVVYRARRHEALRLVAGALARAGTTIPRTSLDSVLYNAQRLTDLVASGDLDHTHLDDVASDLVRLAEALGRGEDPYATARGPLRRAYRSSLDGTLQDYSLYVPPSYRTDRRWPLVITLHGMHGTSHRQLRYVFGFDLDDGESKEHAERHFPALPNPNMLVMSVFGRGDASYKSAGEVDVMDAISQVGASYRVDPDRIYVTGPSMGGIGSGGIPLRNPGVFAAASPLCGYHSYRVYKQVIGRPRQPYEEFLLGNFSNADWAENGEHLPMRVVHGTRDRPVSSEVLVKRYEALRYRVRYDLLEAGHNVWGATYERGGIFDWFRPLVRDGLARHVLLKSSRLRHRTNRWVTIDDARDYGAWVELEATAREGNRIEVRTANVDAFTLTPRPPLVDLSGPVLVSIDGAPAAPVAPGRPLSFVRSGAAFVPGRGPGPGRKRPGLAGPIHDMQYEPVTFVYGTRDPAQTAINRHIAEKLREVRDNATAIYPVVADTDLDPRDVATRSLALIGNPSSNSVLARIQDRLPIRWDGGAIVVGSRRHEGPAIGTMFVYPNPENPERYVLVVGGTDAMGTAYSDHLPELVPDWVVFDRGVLPAQGEVLIADGSLRDAGFFDDEWRLSDAARWTRPTSSAGAASVGAEEETESEAETE